MNEILNANIFFFVTTIAVVIFVILGIIALYYLILILKNAKDVSQRIEKGSEMIGEDIIELRKNVKTEGFRLVYFITFISNLFKKSRIIKKNKS